MQSIETKSPDHVNWLASEFFFIVKIHTTTINQQKWDVSFAVTIFLSDNVAI